MKWNNNWKAITLQLLQFLSCLYHWFLPLYRYHYYLLVLFNGQLHKTINTDKYFLLILPFSFLKWQAFLVWNTFLFFYKKILLIYLSVISICALSILYLVFSPFFSFPCFHIFSNLLIYLCFSFQEYTINNIRQISRVP